MSVPVPVVRQIRLVVQGSINGLVRNAVAEIHPRYFEQEPMIQPPIFQLLDGYAGPGELPAVRRLAMAISHMLTR